MNVPLLTQIADTIEARPECFSVAFYRSPSFRLEAGVPVAGQANFAGYAIALLNGDGHGDPCQLMGLALGQFNRLNNLSQWPSAPASAYASQCTVPCPRIQLPTGRVVDGFVKGLGHASLKARRFAGMAAARRLREFIASGGEV